jgi:hypothetical protein
MSQVEISPSNKVDLATITSQDLAIVDGMKLLLNVDMAGERLIKWSQNNARHIERLLAENGALLIRGLKINSSKQFGNLLETLFDGPLLEYKYRSTPRTGLKGNVYTATEYSAEDIIPQHNENAYSNSWPNRIGFLCMLPSETGGATPISDSRAICPRLPEDLLRKFEEKGLMYVRNYSNVDLPWTEVFQTTDKQVVEQYCSAHNISCEWIGEDKLRTTQVNPAVVAHPVSGEKLWFNQAHLFHVSSLPPEIRKTMLGTFREQDLPRNTYFGDGSAIDEKDLDIIRSLYAESMRSFSWQKHDLLLLDNMLFTHGRESYTGERKILTGMARANS